MRRQLTTTECEGLKQAIRKEWAWSGYYWHPLHPTSRTDVLAFDEPLLERSLPEPMLRKLLIDFGISTVFWSREVDPSLELQLVEVPFIYGGSESVLVDQSLSWVVYVSHEDTITFGGAKLVASIKSAIPAWRQAQGSWA